MDFQKDAIDKYVADMAWRERAEKELAPELVKYDEAISNTIGLRLQPRLDDSQAKQVAMCKSAHRDISLNF